jgi:hypothetical protein
MDKNFPPLIITPEIGEWIFEMRHRKEMFSYRYEKLPRAVTECSIEEVGPLVERMAMFSNGIYFHEKDGWKQLDRSNVFFENQEIEFVIAVPKKEHREAHETWYGIVPRELFDACTDKFSKVYDHLILRENNELASLIGKPTIPKATKIEVSPLDEMMNLLYGGGK